MRKFQIPDFDEGSSWIQKFTSKISNFSSKKIKSWRHFGWLANVK